MRLAATVIAMLCAGAPALAQEFPRLKPGLWEVNVATARGNGAAPKVSTMCLDDSVQQVMYRMSTGMMAGMCSKHEMTISGSKVTTLANCDLGFTKMQSQSVMTLTGNSAYHTESHATFDPPMNGMKESTTMIDGKHIGPCKPGQQPGDMTLPGGQTMNIRQMMGAKGS